MDFFHQNQGLIYMAMAIGVFIAINVLIEMIEKRREKSSQETLAIEAMRRQMSEYDIFLEAASAWNVRQDQVKQDFKGYLRDGSLPFYIRQMLRGLA